MPIGRPSPRRIEQNLGILANIQGNHPQAMAHYQRSLEGFEASNDQNGRAIAHHNLGMVSADRQLWEEADQHFRQSLKITREVGDVHLEGLCLLNHSEVHVALQRYDDARTNAEKALEIFDRLDARVDLVDVTSKTNRLEETYFAVVRDWGQSIESADSYTFGHCERVASYAVAVAEALGADQGQLTTIRMGAYLHDVGKVKVPHQILNKPGKLTDEEFAVIKRHPVWGVELLAAVEFPWDLKPIIRSHHERYDGNGYPDRLRGDEIPLGAQIICIVDVYDALTTTRSYRGAMSHAEALAVMDKDRHWWRPDTYAAFMRSVATVAIAA